MGLKQDLAVKIKELNAAITHYKVDKEKLEEFMFEYLALQKSLLKGHPMTSNDALFLEKINSDENTTLRHRLKLEDELSGLKQTMMLDLVKITKKYAVTNEHTLISPKGFLPSEGVFIRPSIFLEFDHKPDGSEIPPNMPIDYKSLVIINTEDYIETKNNK